MLNRGMAFSPAERESLGLTGRLPAAVLTLEEQADRAYRQLQQQGSDLAKNVYLEQLHDHNETLYCPLSAEYLTELLPVVYDPTAGEAIESTPTSTAGREASTSRSTSRTTSPKPSPPSSWARRRRPDRVHRRRGNPRHGLA
jgi:hypothetical protein